MNGGSLELQWNLKINPEFKCHLLILQTKNLSPQELNMFSMKQHSW